MQSDVILREAKSEDVATVHRLQTAWAAEGTAYGYEAASLDALALQVGPYFLVAEHEGAVVGFVSASVRVSEGLAVVPAGVSYLEVDDLYVTPPFRSQGLGGKLLEAVLSKARVAGLKRCLVYSSTKDARRILDFYEGHGFRSWFVQMFAELEGRGTCGSYGNARSIMKLSVAGQQQAKAFIKSKARPLEQELYAFHLEGDGPEGVPDALSAFQNSDGGYGHGKEPDLPLPDSSAICTTRALQVLAEVGTSASSPLVSGAVRYLLNTYDPKAQVWEIVPRTVNEGPHAPWWHYDDHGQAEKWGGYLVNPRAEILGCFFAFAAIVPSDFLKTLTGAVLEHLENQPDPKNMQDIACCLRLRETPEMPSESRRRLFAKLEPAVAAAVERDPAKWNQYCLKPAGYMGVVRSPASPFAEMLAKELELSLDHEIERQHTDGSWLPTWSWGQFPEAWERAKLAWQGILTVQTLKMLASFARL